MFISPRKVNLEDEVHAIYALMREGETDEKDSCKVYVVMPNGKDDEELSFPMTRDIELILDEHFHSEYSVRPVPFFCRVVEFQKMAN